MKTWQALLICAMGASLCVDARAVAPAPLLGVQHISNGWFHSCAIVGGGVQCWGYNGYGQIANPLYATSAPRPIPALSQSTTAISAGQLHTCAIAGGVAKCWGDNEEGALGSNVVDYSNVPVNVTGLGSNVQAIGAGVQHTCAIAGGGAYCWGDNGSGQLGDDMAESSSNVPVAVTGLGSGGATISAGEQQSCGIFSGVMYCWGLYSVTSYSSTATPLFIQDPNQTEPGHPWLGGTNISVGGGFDYFVTTLNTFSCFVRNAAAYCGGDDSYGEMGNGSFTSFAGQYPVQGLTTGVVAVSAGRSHACALVNNDAVHPVKCWGNNELGQLGDGTTANSAVPVDVAFPFGSGFSVSEISAGGYHTCAVVTIGAQTTERCWGDDEVGQLGTAGSEVYKATPVGVTLTGATAISAANGSTYFGPQFIGYRPSTCAAASGKAYCWGNVGSANASSPQLVSQFSSGVGQVVAGNQSFCARVSGAAWCWGINYSGQLGNGTMTSSNTPVQVSGLSANVSALAMSDNSACAIVSGSVKCWGDNSNGQLGNGSSTDGQESSPVQVVGLTAGATAITVNAGSACAIVSGGVQCWGMISATTTPVLVTGMQGNVSAISLGNNELCAVRSGTLACWDGTTTTQNVQNLSGLQSVLVGADHHCVIQSGAAKCWGSNYAGQLGNGSMTTATSPTTVAGLGSGVTALGGGNTYTCALLADSTIKCWGDDQAGELGDGRILYVTLPQLVTLGDVIFQQGFE